MGRGSDRVVEWLREAREGENPAVPAATVVLVRDADAGLETLMVHKDSKVAFGGMWVFPGGRIDDADRQGADDEVDAARRAAAREALEEAGLAVDPDALEWISFWIPPTQTPRRFATWFFVAPAPEGPVTIDDREIRDHRWMRPDEVFSAHRREEVELAPPTWVTLQWLAEHSDVRTAMAAARDEEPLRYRTRVALVDGGAVAMWEEDAGYESSDPEAPGARHRLWLVESGWWLEHHVE